MNKFAVIEAGGKQYKVKPGDRIKIEKIIGETGEKLSIDKVLLKADEGGVSIGTPHLKDRVEAKILGQGRHERKMVFRYHSKTRYRKKKTHRQRYTEIEILKI